MSPKYEPQFWCVWRENGGSPTVKHATYRAARAEAGRLALKCPGSRFIVLAAAVAVNKRPDVEETRFADDPFADDGIPF